MEQQFRDKDSKEEKYVLIRDDKSVRHYFMANEEHWSHNISTAKHYDKEVASELTIEMTSSDFIVYAMPWSEALAEYNKRWG